MRIFKACKNGCKKECKKHKRAGTKNGNMDVKGHERPPTVVSGK